MAAVAKLLVRALIILSFVGASFAGGPQQKVATVNDEDVKAVAFEALKYPLSARLSHVEGIVVIRATLNSDGNVAQADAISGPKALIADCLANAKKWRFRSNTAKNVVLVYEFRIDPGLCHGAVSSQSIFRPPNFTAVRSCETIVEP